VDGLEDGMGGGYGEPVWFLEFGFEGWFSAAEARDVRLSGDHVGGHC
jgi:hypothetical protein